MIKYSYLIRVIGIKYYFKKIVHLVYFSMVVFMLLGTNTLQGQSNSNNILCGLSKRDNKVYIMVENNDSILNFYQTVEKHMSNLGYWKQTNDINCADMVFIFTGFRIGLNGYPHFECYAKVFDNKMNFIYRGEYLWESGTINTFEFYFDKTINTLVYGLPKTLRNANISKTSPFYVSSTQPQKYDELKFNECYRNLLESIEDKQNNKILENVNKCIVIDPELPELYEIKARVLLEMNLKGPLIPKNGIKAKRGEPFKTIGKLIEVEPLNPNVDYFWQYAREQASIRGAQFINNSKQTIAKLNAINVSLNAFTTSCEALSSVLSQESSTSTAISSSNALKRSGQKGSMKKEKCSFCNGTGKNPAKEHAAQFGLGNSYTGSKCEICGSCEVHYHKSCPRCSGKGYNLRYGYD